MLSSKRNPLFVAAWIGLTCCNGCKSDDQPTATQPTEPALTLIAPQSAEWSREEACAKLAHEELGISAAVRLVRLAEVAPLCVPETLTDQFVRRLRLVRLAEERWALGLTDQKHDDRLRAAILISADGQVSLLAEGAEEEMLILHVSADADIFPHLVVLPHRVLLIEDQVQTAIVLASQQKVRFELREQDGFSYVALVLLGSAQADEVAKFRWDPYELVFLGPAIDKLPDPPGGKFHIDLNASERLEPQGGEIPEPEPIEQEPPEVPVVDEGWLPA